MSIDLVGEGGSLYYSGAYWRWLLGMAYDHGWKPAGTEPGRWSAPETGELNEQLSSDPETWEPMDYFSNGFQVVREEDAANIADALVRGGVEEAREFIAFCRAGSFHIC